MKIIAKIANQDKSYKRDFSYHNRARDAWKLIIEKFSKTHKDATVILPAYIGWSQNEGSGIFDPVKANNVSYTFYSLNKHLQINEEDLKKNVSESTNPLVLLVHYFGFPDSKFLSITKWLDENNIFYVEDSAHAMLTDIIGGICGRKGDYNIYALHKILPVKIGGLLINNNIDSLEIITKKTPSNNAIFSYDFNTIYNIRRHNYKLLIQLIKDIKGITILHPTLKDGVCPQTLPILLDDYNRDNVYFEMNEKGFGFVSLYHTMIDDLKNTTHESVNYTSKKIINLPIHQDCNDEQLIEMSKVLKEVLL